MRVCDIFSESKPSISFEFFPPKTAEQEAHLFEVIAALKKFAPDFVSVTYGAMGTNRERSFFWVEKIKKKFQLEPVAHLTGIASTRAEIRDQIKELRARGAKNILALRGDPPEGISNYTVPKDGFRYAKELIEYILQQEPDFCIGVAGYPEGHPESPDLDKDIEHLQEKVDAGAKYIITQLFFENQYFFDFLERCRKAGIKVPIIPGIMPISSFKQLKKMTDICGATIPPKLHAELEKHAEDKAAIREIGVAQAVDQCKELLKAKVSGIQFFVMNQAEPVSEILRNIKVKR